ncbi:replication-relaxation family protein [Embleya sp. NPDC050493]|uniref:replication-relaxation family protein n=1 Tax=Embleya sp. NPDC050493 TaxID=3363989 RepID=UPI00379B5752
MSGDEVSWRRIQAVAAQLTDCDRLILRTLSTHRVLTTHQITELAFDSGITARHRMQKLVKVGVVDSFRPRVDRGSRPLHFVLTATGATTVAVDTGEDVRLAVRRARRDRALGVASTSRLGHLLGVNGFHTGLVAEARASRGEAEVVRWLTARQLRPDGDQYVRVRPDAVGIWREGDDEYAFALEFDTGSERLARLAEKVDGYAGLFNRTSDDALLFPEWFGELLALVLFCFTRLGREQNARAAFRRAGGDVPLATGAWDGEGSPARALWLPVTGEAPYRWRLAGLGAYGWRQAVWQSTQARRGWWQRGGE